MALDKNKLSQLADFYSAHLVDNIMVFWDTHGPDREFGGFFNCFDRYGNQTSQAKNGWVQGRMTYLYSTLYTRLQQRPQWLAFAKAGRDFLVNHCYKGAGRWRYEVDRHGRETDAHNSYYTDAFALLGLCAYATASGTDQDLPLIHATYASIAADMHVPGQTQFWYFTPDSRYCYKGPSMIGVGLAQELRPVLGDAHIRPMVDACLNRLLYVFYKSGDAFYEVLDLNANPLPQAVGNTINPGHTLEASWFCMQEAVYRQDAPMFARAVDLARAAFDKGWDQSHGGIFAFLDAQSGPPVPSARITPWGEHWDDKTWWCQGEALNAMALAAVLTQKQEFLDRFLMLHEFVFKHFPDPEYPEWFMFLHRDGSPKSFDKSRWLKSGFHIPRNLLNIAQAFKAASRPA